MPRHIVMFIMVAVLSACGIDPLTGNDSPDKSKIAMAYAYRIGDSNTYVSIDYSRDRKSTRIIKLRGIVPVSFKWVTDKELIIYVPNKSLIERMYKGSVDDIKINLVEESISGLNESPKKIVLEDTKK